MTIPVAILAGGVASRLGSIASVVPKALIEVAGRPFIDHQIALLRRNGLTNIVLLVCHLNEVVRGTLGDGSSRGVRIRYVCDGSQPLGTGGAIRNALSQLGSEFFVLYGDSYLDCDYDAVANAFHDSRKHGLMTVYRNNNRWDASNVRFVDRTIQAYDKKHQTTDMCHIDYGLGMFRSVAFEGYPEHERFDLAAVYQALIAQHQLAGFEVPGRFYEIGSPAGLEETRAYLAAKGMSAP